MNLARALRSPPIQGRMRVFAEDFVVDELPSFMPSGAGEHLLLTIKKRGMNTAFCAQQIARWADIDERDVSYAGMKDRHAVTTQRFSVRIPKKIAPDVSLLNSEACQVLEAVWHNRKLVRGALAGNRFVLILRELQCDVTKLEQDLHTIQRQGVPNYFGEQRFGQEQSNVDKALDMFSGKRVDRAKRSIYLSAARSFVFNHLLAQRVAQGDWNRALSGEVWMLDGTKSIFGPELFTETLAQRLQMMDIHPTGPLWGTGALRSMEEVLALESRLPEQFSALCQGLEKTDLAQERRALRLLPKNFSWQFLTNDTLQLQFELPPGAYATSVLAELGTFS